MDIQTIFSSLPKSKGLSQTAAKPLLSLLETQLGRVLEAQVMSARTLKKPEIQLLINERSADKNLPAGTKTAIKTLLSMPNPVLLHLKVEGKALPVLHHRSLEPKQTVTVSVRSDGQLRLLSTNMVQSTALKATQPNKSESASSYISTRSAERPVSGAISSLQPQPSTKPSASNIVLQKTDTPIANKPIIGTPAANKASTDTTPLNSAPAETITKLAEAMRTVLPQAKPLAQALVHLQQNLTPTVLKQFAAQNPSAAALLTRVLQQTLDNPVSKVFIETVKHQIQNSGVSLEKQLSNALNQKKPTSLDDTKKYDLKNLLIQLAQAPSASAPQSNPPLTKTNIDTLLLNLFGTKITSASPKQQGIPSQNLSNSQSLALLQQFGASALARVQLNQFLSANSLLNHLNDPSAPPPTFFSDLTLRWHETWIPVHLQFQDLSEKSENTRKKKKSYKTNKWRVFMELEMSEEEILAVELSSVEKSIGATFWSNSPKLREKTRAELSELKQNLEKQGLQVTEWSCSEQAPPPQDIKLDYALIDIKT